MDTTDVPWSATGLDPLAGRVLEHLVAVRSADRDEVADTAGVSPAEAERALQHLADSALASRIGGAEPRWAAAPPRPSLGALLARRRAELARVEDLVEQLSAAHEAVSGPRATDMVEVLKSEEVPARYHHLLVGSSSEVLHLAKPPYVTGTPASAGAADVTPGVRMRSVYETDGFTDAVSLMTAVRGTGQGGHLRLTSQIPLKLVVFDRAAALLPIRGDRPSSGSLVVHSPALVMALAALFEHVWERAEPVTLTRRHDLADTDRGLPASGRDLRTREILRMMAAGMKDETIARILDLSRRTVQQHITDAGAVLGARTRFQLAVLAAKQGWLTEDDTVAQPESLPSR
ncbi:helix-turn-helix transcriptional regulator [Actinoplanes sp. N902-109]|uniref:helix-turn-helix domain-containing protein n=1 Tax=Actinoplanes sp. (strain N902-109) TaxID=649831 RepID=UPI0003295ED3|nr:helix-turn-helix transcriptional regulator [Actinoplanes sp. N902-109]AGL19139.1 regulatory protein LuxR [Actinoplanes sp. N902-109]